MSPELPEIAGFPILPRSFAEAAGRGLLDSPAMTDRGPILGVDLGEKRIGLAISDPDGSIAFPAGFVASHGRKRDLAALHEIVAQRDVARIVVGLPIHLDGRPSPGSEAARRFAAALGELTGLPVDLLDERWTSRAAERSLSESKGGRKRRRAVRRSRAAPLDLARARGWRRNRRETRCSQPSRRSPTRSASRPDPHPEPAPDPPLPANLAAPAQRPPRSTGAKSESSQFQTVPGLLFRFFRLLNIDSSRPPGVLSRPVLGPSRRGAESFRGPPAATPSGPPLSVPVGLIVEVSENAPKTPAALTILATAGGAGYAPVAPGTFGSAVGVALYALLSVLSPLLFTLTVTTLLFIGIWAADGAERVFGKKDDGRIVIDEVVGQLIALTPLLVAGFLLFRLFDIWKPGPVGWAERRFAGGVGVMLDDVVAGALAGLCVTPLVWIWGSGA